MKITIKIECDDIIDFANHISELRREIRETAKELGLSGQVIIK